MSEPKQDLDDAEFIKLFESGLSSRKVAAILNSTKTTVDHRYKTLKFKPYTETRTCKLCAKPFVHTAKSYRDSTKRCKDCHKEAMRKVNREHIVGKPSHRRKTLEANGAEIASGLAKTFFTLAPNQEQTPENYLDLICVCGTPIRERLKLVLRREMSLKRSCGCQRSFAEKEIRDFLLSLNPQLDLKINTKPEFMRGLELDIYLPELKIAIEYHGLRVHSQRPVYGPKDSHKIKTQHLEKFKRCFSAGIRLIQIFEDEWELKRDIVKSMLAHSLGTTSQPLFARNLEVRPLTHATQLAFFDQNHISGGSQAKASWGLFHGEILISAVSLRTPFTPKPGTLEICRFATRCGYSAVGGFQKLMKHVEAYALEAGYARILSYCDLRFGVGRVYVKAGFQKVGITSPNYFYENGQIREGRFQHRKNSDPEFIAKYGNTEEAQNAAQGWFAIYDAGSYIYEKDLNNT